MDRRELGYEPDGEQRSAGTKGKEWGERERRKRNERKRRRREKKRQRRKKKRLERRKGRNEARRRRRRQRRRCGLRDFLRRSLLRRWLGCLFLAGSGRAKLALEVAKRDRPRSFGRRDTAWSTDCCGSAPKTRGCFYG